MHKNVLSSQVCCASPKKPYITHDELRTLYEGYFKLSDMMRVKAGLATSSCRIKVFFMTNEHFSLYSWVSCRRSSCRCEATECVSDHWQLRASLYIQSSRDAGRRSGNGRKNAETLEERGEEAFPRCQCSCCTVRVVPTNCDSLFLLNSLACHC